MTSSGLKSTATLSSPLALAMRVASSSVWSVITRIVGASRTDVSLRAAGSISVSTVTNLPPPFESVAQVDGRGVHGQEGHQQDDDGGRGDLPKLRVRSLRPGVDDRRQAGERPAQLVDEALRGVTERPHDRADHDEWCRLAERARQGEDR